MGEAQGAASGQSGVGDTVQGLGSLQVLVLDWETGPRGRQPQEQSPQVAQYMCILSVSLYWCADAWGPGLVACPNTHAHSTTPVRSWGCSESCFPLSLGHCPDFGLGTPFGQSVCCALSCLPTGNQRLHL